jgi:hypothetical protein
MKGLRIGRSPAYSAEMIPDPLLPRLPQQLPALRSASQKLARIWLAPGGIEFDRVSVAFTHQVGDGLHSAIIKATKPTTGQPTRATTVAGRDTLPIASQPGCC